MPKVGVDTLQDIVERLLDLSDRCVLDKDRIDALKAASVVARDVIALDTDPTAKAHAVTLTFTERQNLVKKLGAAD